MTDEFTTSKALGWIDPGRMQKDYELAQTYLGMEKPFAVESAFTTKLLDPSVKMDASKEKIEKKPLLRLAVDYDRGVRNRLPIVVRKACAAECLEVIDRCDDAIAAVDERNVGGSASQRGSEVDTSDTCQKSVSGMNEYLASISSIAKLQPGLWCLIGILAYEKADGDIVLPGLSRQRVSTCFDAAAISRNLVVAGALGLHRGAAQFGLSYAIMENLIRSDSAASATSALHAFALDK